MQPPPGLVVTNDALPSITAAIASAASTSLAAAAAAAMASTTASSAASPMHTGDDSSPGECRLLGPFALLVQAALGGLALLSLVYKRWRERPQRPVKIWFFDVSKQVFGSVLVHIANVFMSMLTSGRFSVQVEPGNRLLARAGDDDTYVPNPCSFYLLNLAIDTTIGIPILLILLRVTTGLVRHTPMGQPPESVQSGNYGRPPNAWWWLKQSVIYFCGLFGMKLCVLIIFLILPWISKVGDWALGWTEGNEKLQIAFVMMIFPLIMNAMQYYIIDSFIKLQETDQQQHHHSHEPLSSEEHGHRGRYDDEDGEDEDSEETSRFRLVDQEGSEMGSDVDDETIKLPPRPDSKDHAEYDPTLDGDDHTIIGSSSSTRGDPVKTISPQLLPKE